MSHNGNFPDASEADFNRLSYQVYAIKKEGDARDKYDDDRLERLEIQIAKCNAILYDIGFTAEQMAKYGALKPSENLIVSRYIALGYIDILLYRERKYLSKEQMEGAKEIIQGYGAQRSLLTKLSLNNLIAKSKGEDFNSDFVDTIKVMLSLYDYFLKFVNNKELRDRIFGVLNYYSHGGKEDLERLLK